MVMQPITPEPLSAGQGQMELTDTKAPSTSNTMSMAEKMKQRLKGRSPAGTPAQEAPAPPPGWNPFANFMAEDQVGQDADVATPVQTQTEITTQGMGQGSTATQTTAGGPSLLGRVGATAQQETQISRASQVDDDVDQAETQSATADGKSKPNATAPPTGLLGSMPKRNENNVSSANEDAIGQATSQEAVSAGINIGGAGIDRTSAVIKGKEKAVAIQRNSSAEDGSSRPLEAEAAADTKNTDGTAPSKNKGTLAGLFKKSRKPKTKDSAKDVKAAVSSMGKLGDKVTKAAGNLKSGNVPQIQVGEGPMSREAKEEALERYRDMLESGGGDPFTMLMSAENFGAFDAIKELPPARNHSISEDTVLIGKPASQLEHSLSTDAVVSTGKVVPAHELAHDRVINVQPSKHGDHRLSADVMVPVRAVAPGHYLDADPTISGPQQLFSHELLDDRRVLRSKSPQPHSLELDKTLAMSKKQPLAHDLHSDTILAAPQALSAHDLHSDILIKSVATARGEHDMAHDVRILSPSGAVRDPHSIGDDEVVKENTVFRKSPHPDAMMPGEWAKSSSSGGVASDANNTMASLNASLQTAGQALDELSQAIGAASLGELGTTGMSRSRFILYALSCPTYAIHHGQLAKL